MTSFYLFGYVLIVLVLMVHVIIQNLRYNPPRLLVIHESREVMILERSLMYLWRCFDGSLLQKKERES